MGSSRLPGKVMAKVAGHRVIDLLLARLAKARTLSQIVVATTDQPVDDPFVAHLQAAGVSVMRGSEADVLGRFGKAAAESGADVVVRITGDCPLIMPALVDEVVQDYLAGGVDYVSNTNPPCFPDGLDTEVFSAQALFAAVEQATEAFDREHVTPYLRRHSGFRRRNIGAQKDLSALRLTVDEPADLEVVSGVLEAMAPDIHFDLAALAALWETRPALFQANRNIQRNEGTIMGKGQKLWKRAKQVIPGGNMLLSKRAEMFLPEQWPAYFDRTDGCRIWDLDGNELLDMGIMGIGTNTLGYSHPEVDDAVREVVSKGNLSTLNCPEEVALAERLIEINPWADMVRLARTGGEANAIAIRIARAAARRENVAICGYHGWHDWYLSANLGDSENLAGHLLPGLSPTGVPRSLKNSTFPFMYNDFEGLERLVAAENIGVIKMEVVRSAPPEDGFLHKVRELATANNIVLVFDECTSGFRETFGGLHLKYGVEPDLAVYGKTLGNGYAITAVVGRRAVMEAAQSTFISSTFWTERIGPAAALKTLEVMEREQSWDRITATGHDYRTRLQAVSALHGVDIQISGLASLTGYGVVGEQALEFKTFITQELLKTNILAATGFYASIAHGPAELDRLFDALDPIFATIKRCQNGAEDVNALLEGPVCHAGFKRLN
jgi:glutamate-1-semialdehyde 2,1-aminomutase